MYLSDPEINHGPISMVQQLHEHFSLTGLVIGAQALEGINDLSVGAAMALPEGALTSNLDNLTQPLEQLRHLSVSELVAIAESQTETFRYRFTAGQLLGLLGDIRIDPLNPQMLEVPAAQVTLGLANKDVETVVSKYAHYGVLHDWIRKETPEYQKRLGSYKLSKYCVTNQEYRAFLDETGYLRIPDSWVYGAYPRERGNHPVYSISAQDAEAYIAWLNQKTGRCYRLPTEAEWEYAAAGVEQWEFPWGKEYLRDHCNTLESGILQSTSVGLFPLGAGPFGHQDMAGNVEEYVSDEYHAYRGNDLIVDDLLQDGINYRVTRGGSFTRFRDLARTRRRHGRFNSALYVVGFRLAETIEES